jgi:hypothetical protein
MYACVYLAFKVAQMNVNLDIMISLFPELKDAEKQKSLYDYEFYLINILNYDFFVFSPYKAMTGFLHEIKKDHLKEIDSKITLSEFESKVEYYIDNTFYTDIIFSHSYSIIALACIALTAEFYGIEFDNIKRALSLESIMDYKKFNDNILPEIKEAISKINFLSDEDHGKIMKRIMLFSKANPKYEEKLAKDRL